MSVATIEPLADAIVRARQAGTNLERMRCIGIVRKRIELWIPRQGMGEVVVEELKRVLKALEEGQ